MKPAIWMTEEKCSICGSLLNTDGRIVWCSLVGCSYGIENDVPLLKPKQREIFNPAGHSKLQA